MAKIIEECITIKFSKLIKDSDQSETILTEELITSLEAIVQELVGDTAVIELT